MLISRSRFPGYFIYAGPYKTRTKAESVLEDMYATGEVFESEGPDIRQVKDRHGHVKGYVVLLRV